MAKKSLIERNKKRMRLSRRHAAKRTSLKEAANDPSSSMEEQFSARLDLAKLPRNSSPVRVRLRCEMTGRPRGNYRKFRISRISLRELALNGQIPGMVKSSW